MNTVGCYSIRPPRITLVADTLVGAKIAVLSGVTLDPNKPRRGATRATYIAIIITIPRVGAYGEVARAVVLEEKDCIVGAIGIDIAIGAYGAAIGIQALDSRRNPRHPPPQVHTSVGGHILRTPQRIDTRRETDRHIGCEARPRYRTVILPIASVFYIRNLHIRISPSASSGSTGCASSHTVPSVARTRRV